MKIKSLQIRNFQKHKKLDIDFSPRITTIIGTSDSGKSAIVRALRLIAQNALSGDAYIRNGSNGCRVSSTLSNGYRVSRIRSKTRNEYTLSKKGKKQVFKSFGRNVPDPIKKGLKLDNTNFQNQHDPPFLFFLSPSEAGKELNKVVDLESIDKAISYLSKKVRSTKSKIQIVQERLEEATERKIQLRFILKADKAYQQVEKYDKEIKNIQRKQKRLDDLLRNAGKWKNIASIKIPEEIEDHINDELETNKKLDRLNFLLDKEKSKGLSIGCLKISLKNKERKFKSTMGDVCPLCGSKIK